MIDVVTVILTKHIHGCSIKITNMITINHIMSIEIIYNNLIFVTFYLLTSCE
jgi:hypothetical protein